MISKETATDIAFAYREIETAEKLLEEVGEKLNRGELPDIRDVFGRRHDGLQLGVPTSATGHRLFQVPYAIVKPVIETHIAHHKAKLATLCEKARIELAGGAS